VGRGGCFFGVFFFFFCLFLGVVRGDVGGLEWGLGYARGKFEGGSGVYFFGGCTFSIAGWKEWRGGWGGSGGGDMAFGRGGWFLGNYFWGGYWGLGRDVVHLAGGGGWGGGGGVMGVWVFFFLFFSWCVFGAGGGVGEQGFYLVGSFLRWGVGGSHVCWRGWGGGFLLF